MDPANTILIAVMGVTGSGKSCLIQRMTGRRDALVGNELTSETRQIKEHQFVFERTRVQLVDTPGYDDAEFSDIDIVNMILDWLESSYRDGRRLNGLLYLHAIDHVRMTGSSIQNLAMFRALCGHDALENVFLVTTMWDKVTVEEGTAREAELIHNPDFWGKMVEHGSRVTRVSNKIRGSDRNAGLGDNELNILRHFIRSRSTVTLQAQDEMVNQEIDLDGTTAARLAARQSMYDTMLSEMEQRLNELRQRLGRTRGAILEERRKLERGSRLKHQAMVDALRARIRSLTQQIQAVEDAQSRPRRELDALQRFDVPEPIARIDMPCCDFSVVRHPQHGLTLTRPRACLFQCRHVSARSSYPSCTVL